MFVIVVWVSNFETSLYVCILELNRKYTADNKSQVCHCWRKKL